MNAYDVLTPFIYGQKHIVIAESYKEAEEIFLKDYPFCNIIKIEKISDYVSIKK